MIGTLCAFLRPHVNRHYNLRVVMQGMTRTCINYIAHTALPFFLLMPGREVLIAGYPQIVTFLPTQIKN